MFLFLLWLCCVDIKVKRNYLHKIVTNYRVLILNSFFSESCFILIFPKCPGELQGSQLEVTGLDVR